MISGLKIGNFKAFGPTQDIPLRPITLVFGPNSAGKSSIIQSLLLARHIQDTEKVDAHQTTLGGAAVDLGGFARYVRNRQNERETSIYFSIECSAISTKLSWLDGFETLTIAYKIGKLGYGTTEQERAQIAVTSVSIFLDSHEIHRLKRGEIGLFRTEKAPVSDIPVEFTIKGLRLNCLNPLPKQAFFTTDDLPPEQQTPGDEPLQFFAELVKLRTDENDESDWPGYAEAMQRYAERGSYDEPTESHFKKATSLVPRYNMELLIEVANQALDEGLANVLYLGPLRWIPPRHLLETDEFDASWRAGGGDAWQRLRREPELLERVNHFLRASLRTRYRLECQHFTRVRSAASPAGHSPSEPLSAHLAEDPPPEAKRGVPGADETITILSIVEADTGLSVSHRDVGTGVSQLLPVLVNAAGSKGQLIMIEQPELHLHPALQAELGDVFIESALGENKNTFLIETHSEHLILRLLRRIRETAENALPEGVTPIRPEDVSVLYVEPGKDGSKVLHLPVNAEGDFDKPWPDGFFSERAKELF